MDYLEWNQRIADHFFDPHFRGQPVYMRVDHDELATIAGLEDLDAARQDFCDAIREAVRGDATFARFNRQYNSKLWLTSAGRAENPPPFVAILAASVLAAFDMAHDPDSGISVIAYYPRLQAILASGEIHQPGRDQLRDWWRLLNGWLDSLDGARGRPTARPLSYAIIGFPLSQCTLRKEDRLRLPDFFRWCRLEPGQLIDQEQLISDFAEWVQLNRCTLTPRTTKLLRRLFGQDDADATLEDLISEYERWDGTFREPGGARSGIIELQVKVIREHRRIAVRFVARQPEGFPTGHFTVVSPEGRTSIELALAEPGYYEPIAELPATGIKLRSGFSAAQGDFRLRLIGRPLHVLEEDLAFGDWVSREQPSLGELCFILVPQESCSTLERLLDRFARPGWHRIGGHDPATGVPSGWRGYCCIQFDRVFEAPSGYEHLEPRRRFEVRMKGGLRFGPDSWMEGALPELSVFGEDSSPISVQIDDRPAAMQRPPFAIPLGDESLAIGEHRIKVGNRTVWLRVAAEAPPDTRQPLVDYGWKLESKGMPILASFASGGAESAPALRGAAFNPAGDSLVDSRHVAVYPGHAKVAWLGATPGQISWLQERPLVSQLSQSVLVLHPPKDFRPAWLWWESISAHMLPAQHPTLPVDGADLPKAETTVLKDLRDLGKVLRQSSDSDLSPEVRDWCEMIARARFQRSCEGETECEEHWQSYKRVATELLT